MTWTIPRFDARCPSHHEWPKCDQSTVAEVVEWAARRPHYHRQGIPCTCWSESQPLIALQSNDTRSIPIHVPHARSAPLASFHCFQWCDKLDLHSPGSPSNVRDRTFDWIGTRHVFPFAWEMLCLSDPNVPLVVFWRWRDEDDQLTGRRRRAPVARRKGAHRHGRTVGDRSRDTPAGPTCTGAACSHLLGAVRHGLPCFLFVRESPPRHAWSGATRCDSNATRSHACQRYRACLPTT